MPTQLIVKLQWTSSHTLPPGELLLHPHLWGLEVCLGGVPVAGKLLDLVDFRSQIEQQVLTPLTGQDLNHSPWVNDSVRQAPTCESLSEFFYQRLSHLLVDVYHPVNASVRIVSTTVQIFDFTGLEVGAARFTP